jgi:2-amino-4-hydroxy-6-hydroxymethyldihydropteridine diphosphokinase
MHAATILLGSNINPKENIDKAIDCLIKECTLINTSRIWETDAIGSDGPDFLNAAIMIETPLVENDLKNLVLRKIEKDLGRVRTEDKNAPRPIDLDIIIFDEQVVDQDLWQRSFIACPISDLHPGLRHPSNKKTLLEISKELQNSAFARIHEPTKHNN